MSRLDRLTTAGYDYEAKRITNERARIEENEIGPRKAALLERLLWIEYQSRHATPGYNVGMCFQYLQSARRSETEGRSKGVDHFTEKARARFKRAQRTYATFLEFHETHLGCKIPNVEILSFERIVAHYGTIYKTYGIESVPSDYYF